MNFDINAFTGPIGPYSQFNEDEILLALIEKISLPHSFLEFGAGNGEQNCTRILAERGWTGVWIDADPNNVEHAQPIADRLGIRIWRQTITLDSIAYIRGEMPTNFGVLSIDVDGNDWHFWKALCNPQWGLRPQIVIIESNTAYRDHNEPWVMPYNADHAWDHTSGEFGASVYSMVELGKELGYTFLGKCPDPHSPNLFFCLDALSVNL